MDKNIVFVFIVAGFLFLLTLPLSSSLIECQDQTDIEDTPCTVITPVMNVTAGVDCNATIINIHNVSMNHTVNMTQLPDKTYNFTFPFSAFSTYSITTCTDYSASLDIGHWDEDYNDKWLYFYGVALGLAGLLLVTGLKMEDHILLMLSGFIFVAFSIVFVRIGYPTLTNSAIRNTITLVGFGMGAYLSVSSGLKMMKEGL